MYCTEQTYFVQCTLTRISISISIRLTGPITITFIAVRRVYTLCIIERFVCACVCARVRVRHRFISILLSIDSEIHARTNAKWQRNRVSEHLDTITNSMGDRVAMEIVTMAMAAAVMYSFLRAISSTTYFFYIHTNTVLMPSVCRFVFIFHIFCCSFAIVVLLIPVVHTAHSISIYTFARTCEKCDVCVRERDLLFCKTGCDDCETHRKP